MALETSEMMKDVGQLIIDLGKAVRVNSDGGKKITTSEWMTVGVKFAQAVGADFVDEDDE